MLEQGERCDLIHWSDSGQPMQQSDVTADLYLRQLVFVIVVTVFHIFGDRSERQAVVVIVAEISLLVSVQSLGVSS